MTRHDGLTTILALSAGFAIGRIPDMTEWWQGVAMLVVLVTFLWRFIRATD